MGVIKMIRSRRNKNNDNPIIEAIKWYQAQFVRTIVFIGLPVALLYVGFAWWLGTPAGEEFTGWTEFQHQTEQRKESLNENMEQKYNEFAESTNEDVQNTIDDIQGTEDTTGIEQYSEEVQNTINELEEY